jgi:chromosome partitioning protein
VIAEHFMTKSIQARGLDEMRANAQKGNLEELMIGMPEVVALAARAQGIVSGIRSRVVAPELWKIPPALTKAQVASLCDVSEEKLISHGVGGVEPLEGTQGRGTRLRVSINVARRIAMEQRAECMRPLGQRAVTIAVANFKGGVSKTTTAMCLAQGLSLRGHNVLCVDLDPQGSLTTLFGILPHLEVEESTTFLPILRGDKAEVSEEIRNTYWDGISLVAASPALFAGEFSIPATQMADAGKQFWDIVNQGLRAARERFDVIIIDTPPALSYLTVNALMAADGVVVPVPPTSLDFASLAHFWQLLADFGCSPEFSGSQGKQFSFLHVLLSRVDASDVAMPAVRHWIEATYGDYVLATEIPKTTVTPAMAAAFGTVYDIQKYEGSAAAYKRAIDAYNKLTASMEKSVIAAWNSRLRS